MPLVEILKNFTKKRRLFDKFYFKSTTQMQSRKYICINLFYECIYIFILFFLVYLYRYMSIIIWYKKFSLNIVIKENCAPRKMKIFLCSNRFIDRCHQNEVPSKRKEEKEKEEFVSQMSFPFSRRTIPSSSLKQFRVIMIVMISIMSFINPLQPYIELESTFYYLFHSFLQFKIYIIYA